MSSRIPTPAIAELELDGRLLYRLEQRQESELSDVESAAIISSLRHFADALEQTILDAPAEDILERAGAEWELYTDDPSNVGE